MYLDELIELLKSLRDKHGNLNVFFRYEVMNSLGKLENIDNDIYDVEYDEAKDEIVIN